MNHSVDPETLLAERPAADLARFKSRAIAVGVAGIAASAIGFVVNRPVFFQSYLIAYVFWMGITMGSLALLMLQYLTAGAWGLFARRIFEASTRTLPLMAVLFLPIAFNMSVLYEWVRPEAATDPMVQSKAAYLNEPFFFVRAVLFFVILGVLTYLLNKWSKEQDGEPTRLPGPKDGRLRALSGPGLVLYVLVITFMSVDWVMSISPDFYSTIYGILFLGGQGLATVAFTILVVTALSRTKPFSDVAKTQYFHDYGNLLLAFVLLWAYFNVSQLIIIWAGNLPDEIPWYIVRLHGLWMPVAVAVLIGHFFLPLLLLLSRNLKRRPSMLVKVAVFVLVMRVIDIIWEVAPAFRTTNVTIHWIDFALVIGMGGIWVAYFFTTLAGRALLPAHDPYFKEAMAHGDH